MWITKLKIKHDCVIGNRCKRFGVTTTGTPFSVYIKGNTTYSPQLHTIEGDSEKVREFLNDLKKDKKVSNLEIEGNTIFFIEIEKKKKITSSIYARLSPKIIFVKPVFVDKQGYEYWEVASWDRTILTDFIAGIIEDVTKEVEVLKIEKTKLNDIYFSRLMPKLTKLQKRAVSLAFEQGYYKWPKRTGFQKLSKIMKVSVPTFREHLKKAEEKIMPELIERIK